MDLQATRHQVAVSLSTSGSEELLIASYKGFAWQSIVHFLLHRMECQQGGAGFDDLDQWQAVELALCIS